MKTSVAQQYILDRLAKGKTISQYPTGSTYGYSSMLRWDDSKEVVNCKTVLALQNKGVVINIDIKNEVIG